MAVAAAAAGGVGFFSVAGASAVLADLRADPAGSGLRLRAPGDAARGGQA